MSREESEATFARVQGICPACGGHSLFLGEGGYVTCSRRPCPDPCAATDLLERLTSTPPTAGPSGG